MIDLDKIKGEFNGPCDGGMCSTFSCDCTQMRMAKEIVKLRQSKIDIWDTAIEEAGKKRIMFLTHKEIEIGILEDDHQTIKIRKQMRNEVVKALKELRDKETKR